MEFQNKVEYAIDDWRMYQDDEDISIALARVEFLSDKPNSHKHIYTIDVIKQYADSYLGKFVVADYDPLTNDATTHTNTQNIVGYIPVNQTVQYEQKDDGFWYASVEVAISKIYAPEIYNLFKDNNYRAVSVEQLVGFEAEDEDIIDGQAEKRIVGFEGVGITILGQDFAPSIKGANIQITRMSEDSIKSIEEEYVKYSNKSSNVESISMSDIMAKLENIEQKLNKEENMSELTQEVVENQEVEMSEENIQTEEVLAEVETEETTEETMACGQKEEEMAEEDEATDDDTQVEEEKMSEETVEEENAETVTMADLQLNLAEAYCKIAEYEAELSELRDFKKSVQLSEKENIVTETLSQVKEFCDKEVYAEFEQKAKDCEYANINGWRNEVLASIATKAMAKMSEISNKEEGVLEMGMPETETAKESIYD